MSWKQACLEETVSPCRGTGSCQTWMLSHLLWNHNRHVVPHLLAVAAAFESLSCQVRECWCSFSVPVCGWQRLKNTGVECQRKGNSGLHFHCLFFPSFCSCINFVYFCFPYIFCHMARIWWPLAKAACRWLLCYPAGFPVIWDHGIQVRMAHPAGGCTAWQVIWDQKQSDRVDFSFGPTFVDLWCTYLNISKSSKHTD